MLFSFHSIKHVRLIFFFGDSVFIDTKMCDHERVTIKLSLIGVFRTNERMRCQTFNQDLETCAKSNIKTILKVAIQNVKAHIKKDHPDVDEKTMLIGISDID